ncbi:2Fe-2S ferredoxin-type domain-containing protein [Halteromyces radiatus]|uniref:2Fe-2S ferredoxin-type domain-containing protein n=1 Tax=Halteromyces radiatus TaxID=101107 RepID=UPI00221F3954|nr:2Fe-2S ferredoxin-type domain-containing protein [Halteromyces radiatus]KAI8099941.1 2Fe-2S ferredoxin-type domain-containing protein [Halteromyces radiatus]
MSLLRLFSHKAPLFKAAAKQSYLWKNTSMKAFSTTGALLHGKSDISRGEGPYTVHFITPEGETIDVKATEGDTMLDLAQRYDIDLECACEGSLACSTCHVICDQEYFDRMEEPSDEENDMLDLAFGLTDTSRLGCQIEMNQDLDGITVRIPSATRNLRVDGSKPTHH